MPHGRVREGAILRIGATSAGLDFAVAERVGVDGEVLAAYDLREDPAETLAQTGETAPWSVDLLRRAGSTWAEFSIPLAQSRSIELDAEAENDLRNLGYVE